jgi:lipoprotein-anchoring transpeptidase ErfK/SrfK
LPRITPKDNPLKSSKTFALEQKETPMKRIWLALTLLPIAAVVAQADGTSGAPLNLMQFVVPGPTDLSDYLSPEELEAEMALEGDEIFEPTSSQVRLQVFVDKRTQRLYVFEDGYKTGEWLVSTGTEQTKCAPGRCYRARTPVGTFTPYRMHAKYTSKLWNARMDDAIFITGGIALHATYNENIANLGTRASGGCIRQHPTNADRLFQLVRGYGMGATRVYVREAFRRGEIDAIVNAR